MERRDNEIVLRGVLTKCETAFSKAGNVWAKIEIERRFKARDSAEKVLHYPLSVFKENAERLATAGMGANIVAKVVIEPEEYNGKNYYKGRIVELIDVKTVGGDAPQNIPQGDIPF